MSKKSEKIVLQSFVFWVISSTFFQNSAKIDDFSYFCKKNDDFSKNYLGGPVCLERPNINPSHKLTHAVEKFNDIPIFTVAAEILKKKLVFDIAHYSRSCVCQVVYICNSPNFCLCPFQCPVSIKKKVKSQKSKKVCLVRCQSVSEMFLWIDIFCLLSNH